jgi:hypothetical protein
MSEYLQLIYCSRRRPTGEQSATSEVWNILQVARRVNPDNEVTGALLATSRFFAQVLEGPPEAVELRFERIRADARHYDVTVLERANVTERTYPSWSMGFSSLDSIGDKDASELFEYAYSSPGEGAATAIRELIQASIAELPIS